MIGILVLLFIVMPVLELAVIVQTADLIGGWNTVGLLVLVSVVGAWLAKREGRTAWMRFNRKLASGEVPTDEITNGALILFAGALMMAPGFLTDLLALSLLFPPTRAIARAGLRRQVQQRVTMGGAMHFGRTPGSTPTDDVWDVEGWEDPPSRPGLS